MYAAPACAPVISPLSPDGGLGSRNSYGSGPGHAGTSSAEISVSMKAGRCTATRSGMGLVSAATVMPVPATTSLPPLLQLTTARARPPTVRPTTARRTCNRLLPSGHLTPVWVHHRMYESPAAPVDDFSNPTDILLRKSRSSIVKQDIRVSPSHRPVGNAWCCSRHRSGHGRTVSRGHSDCHRSAFVSYTSRGAITGLGRNTILKRSSKPCGA
jgi:hypothetical protein